MNYVNNNNDFFMLDSDIDDAVSEINESDIEAFFANNSKKNYIIQVSEEILSDTDYLGPVCGIAREETGKYYVVSKGDNANNIETNTRGLIVSPTELENYLEYGTHKYNAPDIGSADFIGSYIDDNWMFYRTNEAKSYMALNSFGMVTRLFSRNAGLLESEIMSGKTAIIIGCGSVGSLVSLELARAGVGNFVLVDSDTLEIHNICRHQLGFRDLGRYKTDALADAIHNINPFAKIDTFRGIIQELPTVFVSDIDDGIIIGTGDNRESSAFACDLAKTLNIPFVATGCWARAHAGECFYWSPDGDLPTYRQTFKNLISDDTPEAHNNYFADDEDEKNLNFEPGVSTDISFVTLVAVKVIYDLLNRNTDGYTRRVTDYLTNYTLICNTNNPLIGGSSAEVFPHPLFISHTVKTGVKSINKD